MPWKRTTPGQPNPYGAEHRRLRRALLPYAIGKHCEICGGKMLRGDKLDLHHFTPVAVGGGAGRKGLVHRRCNVRSGQSDGGKTTARRNRRARQEFESRW